MLWSFLFLGGCSSLGLSGVGQSSQTVLTDAETGEAPVEVKIKSASKDEGLLHIDVDVIPQTAIRTDRLAVALIGLSPEQEVVRKEVALVKDLVAKGVLNQGEEVQVNFIVEAAGISDYEVKCSWGAQALALVEESKKLERANPSLIQSNYRKKNVLKVNEPIGLAAAPKKADGQNSLIQQEIAEEMEAGADLDEVDEFRELSSSSTERASFGGDALVSNSKLTNSPAVEPQVENVQKAARVVKPENTQAGNQVVIRNLKKVKTQSECAKPPCDYFYSLNAVVQNTGSRAIKNVAFGIGIYWKGDQQKALFPEFGEPLGENEEVLEQSNINLAPGESKNISVELEQAIPVVPGGAFVPNIRVLNHS